ncbi:GNAT family N-acetyltransferase [Yoonia sp. SS1-5]|uniref:GNAT family N-acetyltransferase n=1 Tax=Yoonia rhodophyticola TaxID=3137370 RepID=A0AAN0MAT5_9RHOB
MTVTLRPVTKADLGRLFDLKVAPEQRRFVAPNEITLAEAPFEQGSYVFAIWSDEAIVGLIALIDMTEHDDVQPEDEPDSIFIWRLLIGATHQGQGFGKAAIALACDWARARGRPRMSIEVVSTNADAIRLYEKLGFAATGVMYGDEAQMAKSL